MSLRRAADRAESKPLRDTFARYALERARFVHELEIEVWLLGDPENGTEGSSPQRRFSVLPHGPSVNEILATECARADDAAILLFADALRADLSPELTLLLRGHHGALRAARDHMLALGVSARQAQHP